MDFIDAFSKHLIGLKLSFRRNADSETEFAIFSGTYIEIEELNFWLSAGHIIKDIIEIKKSCFSAQFEILDIIGEHRKDRSPLPFSPNLDNIFYVDDDNSKIDFGLIEIDKLTKINMENNGCVAVTEATCLLDDGIETGFVDAVLGFPESKNPQHLIADGCLTCAVMPLKNREIDGSVKQSPIKRFKWKINCVPEFSMVGLSGGPVLTFSPDRQKYWIAAIQGSWNQIDTVYGFNIRYIFDAIRFSSSNENG